MTVFKSALQTESELQWDDDSQPNQGQNCGPSAVEKIANFFKNLTTFGINKTRKLGTNRVKTGTSTTEQKQMLDRRGIPSSVLALSPSAIKDKIRTARRPVVVWLMMKYIPDDIKGHSFDGAHAVAALANGIVDGETGIWVNEPNQHRQLPKYRKNRFYPDQYWIKASAAIGRWCIAPDNVKEISTRIPLKKRWVVSTVVVNLRSGPSSKTTDRGNLVRGTTFTSNLLEQEGDDYHYDGEIRNNWLGLIRNGRQVWVAKAFCKEA